MAETNADRNDVELKKTLAKLLEPGYQAMETGVIVDHKNENVHIRAQVRMPRCKGRMVEWWFGYLDGTDRYKKWHPQAHQKFVWDDKWRPGHYIGATHYGEETLGELFFKVRIKFHDPADVFDVSKFKEARIGGVIYAKPTDEQGEPHGRIVICCRDTEYGCEARVWDWLFHTTDEKSGVYVMTHAIEEMGNLADFLPDLYTMENLH
jgi:hypothetical protein